VRLPEDSGLVGVIDADHQLPYAKQAHLSSICGNYTIKKKKKKEGLYPSNGNINNQTIMILIMFIAVVSIAQNCGTIELLM
jgi:hypothetical protein